MNGWSSVPGFVLRNRAASLRWVLPEPLDRQGFWGVESEFREPWPVCQTHGRGPTPAPPPESCWSVAFAPLADTETRLK